MTRAAQAEGFCHEAFFYAGDDEFLAGTIPYLEEGISAGETVLVVLPESRIRLIREVLGAAAEAVEFWRMGTVGRNPARLISAWQDFLLTCEPGKGVRGLGELISSARSAAEMQECELHELLFNLAFAEERDLTVMCPYDTTALDPGGPGGRETEPSGLRGPARALRLASVLPRGAARGPAARAGPPGGQPRLRQGGPGDSAPPRRPVRPLRRSRHPPQRGSGSLCLRGGHQQHSARRRRGRP